MKMEQNVLHYIRLNHINVSLLSEKTGVSREKFEGERMQEWTAEEFLCICAALHTDPWQFYIEEAEDCFKEETSEWSVN